MNSTSHDYNFILKNYPEIKEPSLSGRYINALHIFPLIENFKIKFQVDIIGYSNLEESIYSIKLGSGKIKILIWSQMHGNESTTTKATFDLLNAFHLLEQNAIIKEIYNNCSLYIIPMLNPDGAKAYTRRNANQIDLNRDAKNLKEVESRILRGAFDSFKPDFCFNLHDQRSIFSAGNTDFPATLSFLTPSMDLERSITASREKSMKVIAAINAKLSKIIPNRIGRYDDAYNSNCTGDSFQSMEVPTILFEAGHFAKDYQREKTREFVFASLLAGLNAITTGKYSQYSISNYFNIPQNEKLFYDIILRNAIVNKYVVDIAIQYHEILDGGNVIFQGVAENISPKLAFYAHHEIDCQNNRVSHSDQNEIGENDIVDKILLNNEILVINYEKI